MFSWHALHHHCGYQSQYEHYFFIICLQVFADPDTSQVLKMEFRGSWKSQIKEVIISQRAIIDCNYLVITMLDALQARGPYVNVCITNAPSSMLLRGLWPGWSAHACAYSSVQAELRRSPGAPERSGQHTQICQKRGENITLNSGLSLTVCDDETKDFFLVIANICEILSNS